MLKPMFIGGSNLQNNFIKFIFIAILVLTETSSLFAQDASSMGVTEGGGTSKKKAVFIKDDPNDTSRWGKVRDIFQSTKIKSKVPKKYTAKTDNSPQSKNKSKIKKVLFPELLGIMVDKKGGSSALLDGCIVKRGSHYEGYKVKKIGNNFITLLRNGKEYVLHVQ